MLFSYFVLALAITLSTIAAWYSIVGLTAIFAAAVVPIIIMGGVLEAAKVTITIWLHQYWRLCKPLMKIYLVSAVFFLMVLTSMGIFGFLSKAHTDQTLVSGDVGAKLAIIDEKIKIERENIANAQSVIKQMDAAVTGVIATGDQEIKLRDGTTRIQSAAERSLQIRRSQAKDRDALTRQIEAAQARIVALQEESAPARAEFRKVEAEVGPIKYIAALIYGDNPGTDLLERAVRWVIIIIVAVFDPLAIMMVLAATESIEWRRRGLIQSVRRPDDEKEEKDSASKLSTISSAITTPISGLVGSIQSRWSKPPAAARDEYRPDVSIPKFLREDIPASHGTDGTVRPAEQPLQKPIEVKYLGDADDEEPLPEKFEAAKTSDDIDLERPGDYVTPPAVVEEVAAQEETQELDLSQEYINYQGKPWRREALMSMHPELWAIKPVADTEAAANVSFGIQFPESPQKSDQFLRVDYLPTKLFKYNGIKWIEVDKNLTDSYSYNQSYIEHLIDKISKGEYDPELLSDSERAQLEDRLKQDLSLKR